ncbi:hypothetical protein A2U94_11495 [Bacillus sp. VT 712]|uniref:Uncharacterized protein n=1 Tax=Priestia veravalensis TaxID=1414648 RepID=A0A0V8JLT3_9BACI|nr:MULTISPECIES: hypothetical protein [Bacillaceae]KSU88020.1 hypothetical protein AS180_09945 [Priestia veravalensis]KZB91294.1 hypothetical protein A2U94_11495 [Bacillus sp. VT 712]MCP1188740.1 hypothetical protein [Priestia flexa]SCC23465.1 hypothetical protein GA0061087_102020 [Priestia flexa]
MYHQYYPYGVYRTAPNGEQRFFALPFVAGLAGGLLGGLAVSGFGGRPVCCPPFYPYPPTPYYGGPHVYNTFYGAPGTPGFGPIPR